MKSNTKYQSISSPATNRIPSFGATNKKWSARNERTMNHNLTIGLKDEESFMGKENIL